MTVTASGPTTPTTAPVAGVTLTVDGVDITVPKGTLVIRAAEPVIVDTGFDAADLNICENLYAQGASAVQPPAFSYSQYAAVVTGDAGGSGVTAVITPSWSAASAALPLPRSRWRALPA